jgi:hypothetical protein
MVCCRRVVCIYNGFRVITFVHCLKDYGSNNNTAILVDNIFYKSQAKSREPH